MVGREPPRLPRSAAEVLEAETLPDGLVEDLSVQFRVAKEDRIAMDPEAFARRIMHESLGQLATRDDPILGLSQLVLLAFNRDGVVHLLYLISSVPVDVYLMQH